MKETNVVSGEGLMIAVAVGDKTEFDGKVTQFRSDFMTTFVLLLTD